MGVRRQDVWSDVNNERGQLGLVVRDVGSSAAHTMARELERAGWRVELRRATSGAQPGWSRRGGACAICLAPTDKEGECTVWPGHTVPEQVRVRRERDEHATRVRKQA